MQNKPFVEQEILNKDVSNPYVTARPAPVIAVKPFEQLRKRRFGENLVTSSTVQYQICYLSLGFSVSMYVCFGILLCNPYFLGYQYVILTFWNTSM